MGQRPFVVLLAVAVAAVGAGSASAATPTDTSALRDAVKVGNDKTGIKRHLKQLQVIADANRVDGVPTRATSTPGHVASAAYVRKELEAAGYKVSYQPFTATVFDEPTPPAFSQVTPTARTFAEGTDFLTMEFSGSGTVTGGALMAIDFTEPTTQANASTSGCEAADFPASVAGKVALIQRGTCTFGEKAQNAQNAGAAAAVIFNEGTTGAPDRQDLLNGTLGAPVGIPVLGTTYDLGRQLVDAATAGSATVSLTVNGRTRSLPTKNVIADTPTGRTDRTVVVGAHLDSVFEGPGINDDGSGTSTDLEVALQMAKLRITPVNRVRFIFFSGEEQGLLGSDFYVSQLTKQQIQDTAAMLDFDMLASPNYARFVYDGDGSSLGPAGPNGSGTVEAVFSDFFDSQGLFHEPTAFDGRSDYDAFTQVGIPAGGIFSGAEVHKSAAQQAIYGGAVGEQFDPCYHEACDRYPANINDTELARTSDAVAHAVLTFAQTTSAVNGTDNGSTKSTKSSDWKGPHRVR
jgi:Zn-dependent M28 family amino/carboxypeptidase